MPARTFSGMGVGIGMFLRVLPLTTHHSAVRAKRYVWTATTRRESCSKVMYHAGAGGGCGVGVGYGFGGVASCKTCTSIEDAAQRGHNSFHVVKIMCLSTLYMDLNSRCFCRWPNRYSWHRLWGWLWCRSWPWLGLWHRLRGALHPCQA